MEEKSCYRCGTKHLINEINFQMENCSHIYCANCIFQEIFIKKLTTINEQDNFTLYCKCDNGSIQIPIDSVESLFSKKYTVDSEEIKEKNFCEKHKDIEKNFFCKTCKMYVCPQCTKINTDNIDEGSSSKINGENMILNKESNDMNEHDYHQIVKAEDICNKYKDFLKDIQIENKTANQFVEKFNIDINKYENELEGEINSTLKIIDDIIDKLYKIKEDYTKILDNKYSRCNKILKIIKLFYANYYLDYENRMNINDVFTLEYLKNVNYEFNNLEFNDEKNETSLENILIEIKNKVDKINIKKDKADNNYRFNFVPISRKFNAIQKLIGHRQMINCIIELNDGRLLTGSSDYKMKFWEEQGGKFIETLTISELTGDILCLYELKDLRIISTLKNSGAMKVWSKKKNVESYELTITLSEHKSSVTSIIQLPDERLITGSKDKTILIWEISENTFKCIQNLTHHTGGIYSLCQLTGVRFASGSEDKTICIWEEDKGTFKNVNTLKDHKTRVRAMAITNQAFFITGGDKIIIVYKLKDEKFIKIRSVNAHSNYITKIIKLQDGKIASAGRDSLIKIWNEKNGELSPSETLRGHTHSVYDIIELKDGRLASVSGDNLVIIWKSGKIID